MNDLKFALLSVIPSTIIVFIIQCLLGYFYPEILEFNDMLHYSMIVFGLLTFFIVFLGARTVNHNNRYYFSWVTIFGVFIKLACGVLLVVVYQEQLKPDGYIFIIPFFVAYIIYMVSEIATLQQILANSKKS
jgi:hypothetical protein